MQVPIQRHSVDDDDDDDDDVDDDDGDFCANVDDNCN